MSKKKTQSEVVANKNKKAVQKHRQDVRETAELQKRVAKGELTAGDALRSKAGKLPTPAPAKATEDKNKFKVLHGGLPTAYLEIFERWFAVGKKNAAGLARCADENGVTVRDLIDTMPEKLVPWGIKKFTGEDVQIAESILHEISENILNRVKERNDKINAKFGPKPEIEFVEPGKPAHTVTGDEPKRKKWNGFPITAVVRWMGVEGWSAKQAAQVLEDLGFDLSPATIAAQLRAGKLEERGPPADLNPQQEKELNKLLK